MRSGRVKDPCKYRMGGRRRFSSSAAAHEIAIKKFGKTFQRRMSDRSPHRMQSGSNLGRKGPQMGHAHPIHSFKAAAKSAEIVIVMNSRRPCRRRWIYEAKTIGARAQIEVRQATVSRKIEGSAI